MAGDFSNGLSPGFTFPSLSIWQCTVVI